MYIIFHTIPNPSRRIEAVVRNAGIADTRECGGILSAYESGFPKSNPTSLNCPNNACERLIGSWIKKRYRTMRGYKRTLSIRHVVAVTSLLGAAPEPYDMGLLYE